MNALTPAPANSGPITIFNNVTPRDPALILDGEPLRRATALHQRSEDIFATVPSFETVQEQRTIKQQHANRIAELLRPRSDGGFGESEEAGVVKHERQKLQRANDELVRLETLKEVRTSRWTRVAQLDRAVIDWLHGGIPGGVRIEAIADAPLDELLVKDDRNRIDTAVDRYRLKLKGLAEDLRKVKSAPWPSSAAKAAAKTMLAQIATAAAPDVARAISNGLPVSFPTMMQTAMVRGVDVPAAAFTETTDSFGVMCWLFQNQMQEKIFAAIDAAASDKDALSQEQREQMEATITAAMLDCERLETACIWAADSEGEVIDFRSTTDPRAVLGVRLIAAPGVAVRGSSVDHAYDVVGVR